MDLTLLIEPVLVQEITKGGAVRITRSTVAELTCPARNMKLQADIIEYLLTNINFMQE
jgi:hypothetical protein